MAMKFKDALLVGRKKNKPEDLPREGEEGPTVGGVEPPLEAEGMTEELRAAIPEEDRLGGHSLDYAGPDREQRLLRYGARLAFGLCVLLLGIVYIQSSVIVGMRPLQRWVPAFIQVTDGSDQLLNFKMAPIESTQAEVIKQKFAMEYIRIRHEVVPIDEEMRLRFFTDCLNRNLHPMEDRLCAYIAKHSTEEVYERFMAEMGGPLKELLTDEIQREVRITADPIQKSDDEIEIRMETIDYERIPNSRVPNKRRVVDRASYIVNIWVGIGSEAVTRNDERFLNPELLFVYKYEWGEDISKKGVSQ